MVIISKNLRERLSQFNDEQVRHSRGSLSLVLTLTRNMRGRDFPLHPKDFETPGGGQVAGLGGGAVKRILTDHGIEEIFSLEGGRTSRGNLDRMRLYVDLLNELAKPSPPNLEAIEAYWVERVREVIKHEKVPLLPDQKAAPAQYEWHRSTLRVQAPGVVFAASIEDFADIIFPLRADILMLEAHFRGSNQHRLLHDVLADLSRQLDGEATIVVGRDFAIGYAGIRLAEVVAEYQRSDESDLAIDSISLGRIRAALAYFRLLERHFPRWMAFKSEQSDIRGYVEDPEVLQQTNKALEALSAELRQHPEIIDETTPTSLERVQINIQTQQKTVKAAVDAALATIGNLFTAIASPILKWAKSETVDAAKGIAKRLIVSGIITFIIPSGLLLASIFPNQLGWLKPIFEFLKGYLVGG